MLCDQKSAYLQKFNDIMYVLAGKAHKMLQTKKQNTLFRALIALSAFIPLQLHIGILSFTTGLPKQTGGNLCSLWLPVFNKELVGPSVMVSCVTPSLMVASQTTLFLPL